MAGAGIQQTQVRGLCWPLCWPLGWPLPLVFLLAPAIGVAACRTAASRPAPALPAKPAPPPFELAKLREDLQISPLEIVWSGVRGQVNVRESVGIRNVGAQAVQISSLDIGGPNAASFAVVGLPALPLALSPGKSLSVEVGFAPAVEAEPGVHRAMLHVYMGTGSSREEGPPVDLSGLVTAGEQGEKEPPLQQVALALGFGTDVGGLGLRLGVSGEPVGDEVHAGLFRRARPTPVSLYPVARYSPDEPLPYGTYRAGAAGKPVLTTLAVIAAGQEQTLNPELEADGRTTFDAGDEAFGVFVKSRQHTTFTEDRRNTGPTRHAARVYPLKGRSGAAIPDAYLVAFEEARNGDYNDYVFVIWNVRPADPAP